MNLFEPHYQEITDFLGMKKAAGDLHILEPGEANVWPASNPRQLVLGRDTAVELGNPRQASTSFLVLRSETAGMEHGRISLVGPDLMELNGSSASFGKIVLVGADDLDGENILDRYREMELTRYDIRLEGYMMRGVSQFRREWSRVSHEAIDNGFSFRVLGDAVIDRLVRVSGVRVVEVIFITSCKEDVVTVDRVGEGIMRIVGAMNKMATEVSADCDTCEYADVCDDVAELRAMRHRAAREERAANG